MSVAPLRLVSADEAADDLRGASRIPGAKIGKSEWWFRPSDRVILQVTYTGTGDERRPVGEAVGYVPKVTGWVTAKADDGSHTAICFRLEARDGRTAVVSEDDLDRGTWAGPVGQERPTGMDAKQAFAQVIRIDGREQAPEVTSVPYMEHGALVFPEHDTQSIGYRVLAGEEEQARKVWQTVMGHALRDDRTVLALGFAMGAPLVRSFGLLAHILNLVGPTQQGKSTTQTVQAAVYGKVEGGVMREWDSSAQGIPQLLRGARLLPIFLEEHSSKGDAVAQAETMLNRIVSGASRTVGTADQRAITPSSWRSGLGSSSNETLKRPGQTEALAARLYELRAPFWADLWVDYNGRPAERGPGALHLAEWVTRAADEHHGWPLEWAIRDGWFTAERIAELRRLHDAAAYRLTPTGGGLAGTVGKIHALWCVGAYILGQVLGVEGLAQAAERAAAAVLPDALTSAAAVALTPAERLWEGLGAGMAKAHHFPVLDMTDRSGAIDKLDQAMREKGSDVHGWHTGRGGELWVITGKLKEIAKRHEVTDHLHSGLEGLKDLGVLKPGGKGRLSAKPPRALRSVPGLGSWLYRFDLRKAGEVFELDEDDDQGGGGGGGGAAGPDGTGPRTCTGYLPSGAPCGMPLDPAGDDGTGIHASCNPTPYGADWPAGTVGAQIAQEEKERQALHTQEELSEQSPEPPVPARADQAKPVPAPRAASIVPLKFGGAHGAFIAQAGVRRSVVTPEQTQALADRLALLDQYQEELSAMDTESMSAVEYGEERKRRTSKLRMLDAMTGTTKDPRGPFAPTRRGREPRWVPERPAVVDAARVSDGWSWEVKEHTGDVMVLDRNGSWPTAASSVQVVHGQFEHTGPMDDLRGTPRPGYYHVTVYPWTEQGMPSPMGTETVGEERWVTGTRLALLAELAAAGRWPDASASDSWTGEPVRLSAWAHLVGELRRYALEVHGRDSEAYGLVKEAFGMAMGLLTGSLEGEGAQTRRKWTCRARRTDWVHAIKDQASATIWRTADKARVLGYPPLAMRNVDELVLPADALQHVAQGPRPVLRLDETGVKFGTWKVKGTESWDGAEES